LLPADEGRFPVIGRSTCGAWRLARRNGLTAGGHYFAARGYVLSQSAIASHGRARRLPPCGSWTDRRSAYIRSESQALRMRRNRIGLFVHVSRRAPCGPRSVSARQSDYFTGAYPLDKHTEATAKAKVVAGSMTSTIWLPTETTTIDRCLATMQTKFFFGATSADDPKVHFERHR